MVVYTSNPSMGAKVRELLQIWSQPGLQAVSRKKEKKRKKISGCYFSFDPRFWFNKLIQLVILKFV